ncbi:hypothetical protein Avbf_11643 [Armadillidium vulgare]|nr:hypothetical protein Avbf_11643 [Armadillidium vulgare]
MNASEPLKEENPIRILRSEVSPINGANFSRIPLLDISRNRKWHHVEKSRGVLRDSQYAAIQSCFIWPLGDGTFGEVRYVADENGYRPESSLIPTPHPLPAHAVEQIRIAEEQRARGIRWDEQGFQI